MNWDLTKKQTLFLDIPSHWKHRRYCLYVRFTSTKRLFNMSSCFLSIARWMARVWLCHEPMHQSIGVSIVAEKEANLKHSIFSLCCIGQLSHHHQCQRWDLMPNLKSILNRSLVHCCIGFLVTCHCCGSSAPNDLVAAVGACVHLVAGVLHPRDWLRLYNRCKYYDW